MVLWGMHSSKEIEMAGIYTNDTVSLALVFQDTINNLKLPNICLYKNIVSLRTVKILGEIKAGARNGQLSIAWK